MSIYIQGTDYSLDRVECTAHHPGDYIYTRFCAVHEGNIVTVKGGMTHER